MEDFPFTLFPRVTFVKMVGLDMLSSDVTLSMDWLHAWYVFIDDRIRMVRSQFPYEPMTRVKDIEFKTPPLESVPVVNEFLEVLPDGLPVFLLREK